MTDTATDTATETAGADESPYIPTVVFACRANGGRSVVSRLLTEHYAQDRVIAVTVRWPILRPGRASCLP